MRPPGFLLRTGPSPALNTRFLSRKRDSSGFRLREFPRGDSGVRQGFDSVGNETCAFS